MIIDILEWDITYTDLMNWIATTGAVMHAISGYGVRGVMSTLYRFENEDDFIAFKLAFPKDTARPTGYRGHTVAYSAAFYAPYVPYPAK